MPTFPTYRGEMPKCLNPLNPRHCLLLIYWLFFRPTAIKYYLYQAKPDTEQKVSFFAKLQIPAYRSLYLAAIVDLLILSAGLTPISRVLNETSDYWKIFAISGIFAFMMNIEFYLLSVIEGKFAFGVMSGTVMSIFFGLGVGTAGVIIGSIEEDIGICIAYGIISSLIGSLHGVFYPVQFGLALCSLFRDVRHPLLWDELIILPLPRSRHYLLEQLHSDETQGIMNLVEVSRNPFQRWAMQSVFYKYLHEHQSPITVYYDLLTNPSVEEFVIAPVEPIDWEWHKTFRHLFLGECALHYVNITGERSISDRLVWRITNFLRFRRETPLTRFAEMLYDLLNKETVEDETFTLSTYADCFHDLNPYYRGVEIAQTFDAMTAFLSYENIIYLPTAASIAAGLCFNNPIRPTVFRALRQLGKVGAEIATYCYSTSRSNKLAALARATDALKDLDEYTQQEVMVPEQYLLRRIIRQWQALIIEAGGELGRAESAGPAANPYVAGNPVTGRLFVGRDDILRRLEELWRGAGQKPSVVIYGHRRMGKTSILHNLGARFGKETLIIDFNMQRVGQVESAGELLLNLALAIYDALHGALALPEPTEDAFLAHNPFTAFDRFLKQLDGQRGARQFIVAIDEFELLERKIEQGKLTPQLLDYWRGLFQSYSWFVMAFAGLHTLEEMTRDYWQPLFGSVTKIPVSFLSAEAARRLITNPADDFDLDYGADALDRIILLTNGQPYLIQLLCHGLVTRFNRQNFEEGAERERRFHLDDVDAVVASPEFFRDGDAYFSGVWAQAENGEQAHQQTILRVFSRAAAGMTIQELATQSGLNVEQTQAAVTLLRRHDVVAESDEGWRFTVELMRQWVAQKEVKR